MSRTFVTTSGSAMKLFGPTSCSAKRSDLFLLKVWYVLKKRSTQHLQKTQGHWRVCLPVFVFTPWCIRLCFLLKQTHWRSHCIYTGFRMDSHFFFLQKNLRVQNGVQNGVQNRVQIRGPKGGSTFCQHPLVEGPYKFFPLIAK